MSLEGWAPTFCAERYPPPPPPPSRPRCSTAARSIPKKSAKSTGTCRHAVICLSALGPELHSRREKRLRYEECKVYKA